MEVKECCAGIIKSFFTTTPLSTIAKTVETQLVHYYYTFLIINKVCYRLSKRPNCFRGTCSGLGTWRPRCTRGALSGTRHVVPLPSRPLIAHVTAPLSGAASPMGPVSYMTRASAPVPVHSPQLSLRARSYPPITPNPCTLGQQVIALLSHLIVSSRLVYFYSDHS